MIAAFLLAIVASPAAIGAAQETPVLPQAESSDDVIITGLNIPRDKLPTGVFWDYEGSVRTRTRYEKATMFMRCALKTSDARYVRQVVDGEPNSSVQRFAQGAIIRRNQGCYPQLGLEHIDVSLTLKVTDVADYGESMLDRSIIFEQVLRSYAPDAALTPQLTQDEAVKSRFRAREAYRNRLRFRDDQDAFIYASCLVEKQPILATRLVRSAPGSKLEQGLTQAIIVQGRECLAGTTRVTVSPVLLRAYVVDAFYRWVLAARNIDTLLPANG